MRIAVGFATSGRGEVLRHAVDCALTQSLPPDKVIICYTKPSDVTGLSANDTVTLHESAPGLPKQRNVVLDSAADCDLIVFFDDDFLAAPRYLEAVRDAFAADPTIVASTGLPIADDAKGPGLSVAQGLALIAADSMPPSTHAEPAPHAYGCNMAIRLSTVRAHALRFDERLPLYAWSEDIDFAHRIKRHGRIVKLHGARGVHLGAKTARSSGRRLGYSQVANPIYLRAKGSYSWRRALGSVGRNVAANGVGALWSEPWIDRRGRLLGNALAFVDLMRGRLAPERVLDV